MKPISESCCGRERASLKLKLGSTTPVCLMKSPHTYQCKQSGNISLLFYTYLPNATFHSRWIFFSSLTYTVSKIFIFQYPSSKQFVKTSLVYTPFEGLFSEFEPICIYDLSPPTLSRFLSFPENTGSWQLRLPFIALNSLHPYKIRAFL